MKKVVANWDKARRVRLKMPSGWGIRGREGILKMTGFSSSRGGETLAPGNGYAWYWGDL